ncbi:MAG: polymerase [Acidimicrobiales bacterium]|nr:polymerase [Acidimicrobiales bacterium]
MGRRPSVYGLDIETDTTINGLDPAVARVLTVALSGDGFDEVFSGPEPRLLADLDSCLSTMPAGVLATWNGAAFDLPFLAQRARMLGVPLGLRLRLDKSITLRRAPLPGHAGAYRGGWYQHGHLDAYRLYRGDVGPALRVSCSLKAIARLVGLAPVEVDRTRIHDLSHEALHAYAASDARLARVLTERRWATASRFVDRLTADEAEPIRLPVERRFRPAPLPGPAVASA